MAESAFDPETVAAGPWNSACYRDAVERKFNWRFKIVDFSTSFTAQKTPFPSGDLKPLWAAIVIEKSLEVTSSKYLSRIRVFLRKPSI